MTATDQKQLGKTLWNIADQLRGAMNADELKAVELMRLQPAEQQRIAACLSTLDAVLAGQSQKLAALRTHKQALMQQLFPVGESTEPGDCDAAGLVKSSRPNR